jgi:hypothetical protein
MTDLPTVPQNQQPLILLPCLLPADSLPPLALEHLQIFLAFAPALPMARTKDLLARPSPYCCTGRPSTHMTTTSQPSPFCLNNDKAWTDGFPSIPAVMDGTAPPDPRTTPYYNESSPYTSRSYIPPVDTHPWSPPSLPLFLTNLPSVAGLNLLVHDDALHSSIYDWEEEEVEDKPCYPDTPPPTDSEEEGGPSAPPPVNHCITIDMMGVHDNEEAILHLEAMLEHMQEGAPGENWELVSGCIHDLQEAFRAGAVTIHTTHWPEGWSTTSLEDVARLATFPCLQTPSPPLLLAPIIFFFFFFFWNRLPCALGYRTPCSTSVMYVTSVSSRNGFNCHNRLLCLFGASVVCRRASVDLRVDLFAQGRCGGGGAASWWSGVGRCSLLRCLPCVICPDRH